MTYAKDICVLHVDDEPDIAELTAEFLKREDDRFTIETATSAREGLKCLSHNDFDCVISDYDMPGQNGIEFLSNLFVTKDSICHSCCSPARVPRRSPVKLSRRA